MTFNQLVDQGIHWPAVICYSGDDELMFIASHDEWEADTDLHTCIYDDDDCLIDSMGRVFHLNIKEKGRVVPLLNENTLTLEALTVLIKKHYSAVGLCCSEKIFFTQHQDAIHSLKP